MGLRLYPVPVLKDNHYNPQNDCTSNRSSNTQARAQLYLEMKLTSTWEGCWRLAARDRDLMEGNERMTGMRGKACARFVFCLLSLSLVSSHKM